MCDPLRDAWIKYNRATEQLRSLIEETFDYLGGQPPPYDIEVEFETAIGSHLVRIRIGQTPDTRFGAIVGDIVHNLRSALDVTAWQMAIRDDEAAAIADPNAVQFPLTSNPTAFKKHRALPFVSQNARAVVEECSRIPVPVGRRWGGFGRSQTPTSTESRRPCSLE